jgi:sugar lactone lactonase YvrE
MATMKWTAGILAAALAGIATAHEGHHHAPAGQLLTVAVETGSGDHVYENVPWWGTKENTGVGSTNGGVAIDKAGRIYVSTDTPEGIQIYEPSGKRVGKVGPTKVHNLFIREEDGVEYLWIADNGKSKLSKLTMDGKEVFAIPNEKTGEVPGGFKGITAADIAPDGSIFVAIGYGSSMIHKFDPEGTLLKSFAGGKKKEDGMCKTSHGIAIDPRFSPARLMVADRENGRVTHFDLDGNWIGVVADDLRRPTDVAFRGDFCAVAELAGGVVILDKDGKRVALLGENPNAAQRGKNPVKPEDAKPGHFTAPHGLSYDAAGNLYVQDWNRFGRITKLVKIDPKSTN